VQAAGDKSLSNEPSMNQKNQPSAKHQSAPAQRAGKKSYSKPEFRYERVFETLALSCGKIHGHQGQCRFNRKRS
jgi:hypothetical protein